MVFPRQNFMMFCVPLVHPISKTSVTTTPPFNCNELSIFLALHTLRFHWHSDWRVVIIPRLVCRFLKSHLFTTPIQNWSASLLHYLRPTAAAANNNLPHLRFKTRLRIVSLESTANVLWAKIQHTLCVNYTHIFFFVTKLALMDKPHLKRCQNKRCRNWQDNLVYD
jgi:hypothetical protein